MALTTRLPWNVEKRLQNILENVSLTLLYKSAVHGKNIVDILTKCTGQGPTVTVIYCQNYIFVILLTDNYPAQYRPSIGPISSLLFSFKSSQSMEMSTEFLNIKQIEADKKKLRFHSFGEVAFCLIPSEEKCVLCCSLIKKLNLFPGISFFDSSEKYYECEVFRVEGIKLAEGYISKIARVTQHRQNLLEDLRKYKIYGDLFSEIRILLLGPVGSGKSSFINSVKSVFHDRIARQAPVGSDTGSITEQYRIYSIKNGKYGKTLPFMLCDSMGLDDTEEVGLCVEDIPHILKGSMPDRYQFNPHKPITAMHPNFITSPSLEDRIHCVAYVLDINSVFNISSKMVAKLKQIQKEVLNHGIPLVALITKVQDCSGILQDNFLNMNEFITSDDKIINFTKMLNIPIYNILMVQNYASELTLNPLKDVLILTALKQMLRAANAALEDLPLEEPV